MADEKVKIVTDATGPGSDPALAQPEVDAQVSKQEQSAPEAPSPEKAEAPTQEAPVPQDKAAGAPKEQKAASVSVFNFSEIMAEKKATERAAAQRLWYMQHLFPVVYAIALGLGLTAAFAVLWLLGAHVALHRANSRHILKNRREVE